MQNYDTVVLDEELGLTDNFWSEAARAAALAARKAKAGLSAAAGAVGRALTPPAVQASSHADQTSRQAAASGKQSDHMKAARAHVEAATQHSQSGNAAAYKRHVRDAEWHVEQAKAAGRYDSKATEASARARTVSAERAKSAPAQPEGHWDAARAHLAAASAHRRAGNEDAVREHVAAAEAHARAGNALERLKGGSRVARVREKSRSR